MRKAIVAGSFDPITRGHLYVVEQALKCVDEVYIVLARNSGKSGLFSLDERSLLIENSVKEVFGAVDAARIKTCIMPDKTFTAHFASSIGANIIFRGIRNVVDFEQEHALKLINSFAAPEVTTVFVMPPAELTAVSSSAIKGMVGLSGWQGVVSGFLPRTVITALENKHLKSTVKSSDRLLS